MISMMMQNAPSEVHSVKSSRKRVVAVLAIAVLLGAAFSFHNYFLSDDENNVIEVPDYTVKLNTYVNYQCIDVKEITANFENGNVTSLDVKIGLLPGSVPLDMNDLIINLDYIDRQGRAQFDDYIINSSLIHYGVKKVKITDVDDPYDEWDSTTITQNSTITLRFDGEFNCSQKGTMRFHLPTYITKPVEIILPPFITSPPLYSKYGGMALINRTESSEYPAPSIDDWIIDNDTVIEDRAIVLNNNIIVTNDASLTLKNVSITVNDSKEASFNMFIGEGAVLTVENSSIATINTTIEIDRWNYAEWYFPRYEINVFGKFYLNKCNLSYSQGLNIYGGLSEIENSTFYKSSMRCYDTNLTIRDNTFSSSEMQLTYGSYILENNNLDNFTMEGWGEEISFSKNIFCNGTSRLSSFFKTSYIKNNNIQKCECRMHLEGLSYIIDNEFYRNEKCSIMMGEGPSIIRNNSFIDTGWISTSPSRSSEISSGFQCIIESNMIKSDSGGFYFHRTNAYLNNNEIINSRGDNIGSYDSSLVIVNNTMRSESGWNIGAVESSVLIINTSMDGYRGTLDLTNSSATIIDSVILNDGKGKYHYREGEMRDRVQFSLEQGSTIRIKNTEFDEDEVIFEDYKSRLILPHKTLRKEKPPPGWRFYANIALVVTTVLVFTLLVWRYRRGKRKEGRRENEKGKE